MPEFFEPIRKEVTVLASQAKALEAFALHWGDWHPAHYHIGKSPVKTVVLEPYAGGRWFEVGQDGVEADWGRVLAWEPPHRLLLNWQLRLSGEFDSTLMTEVEVRFDAMDSRSTRVTLVHRQFENFGNTAADMHAFLDGPNAWAGNLGRFADYLSRL